MNGPDRVAQDLPPARGGTAPRTPGRRRSGRVPEIDPAHCTGCGRCVAACELQLLSLEVQHWKKSAVLHGPERCTGCNLCVPRCPFDAITLRKPALPQATLTADGPDRNLGKRKTSCAQP